MKRIIVIALGIFLSISTFGQGVLSDKIDGALLQEDLAKLLETIEATHQNPTFYANQTEITRRFKLAHQRVMNGADTKDFIFQVAHILQVYQDSHTYPNYRELSRRIGKEGAKALPFGIMRIEGDLLITYDKSGEFPRGTIIQTINDKSAFELLGSISKLSVFEGKSTIGNQRIAEAIYTTLIGLEVDCKEGFKIEAILPDGSAKTATVDGRSLPLKSGEGSDPWSLEIDDTLAVLSIKSFSSGKERKYFKFLEKSFKEINAQGVRNLAIDLRDNTGGKSERMERLFDYIMLVPPNVPANIIAHQSELSQQRFRRSYKGLTKFFMNTFYKKDEDVQNFVAMANLEVGETDTVYYQAVRKPSKHRFKGNLYLMINGRTGSASANFASVFRQERAGTIVGEPCLGPNSGTWGNPVPYTLEHSQVKVYISSIRFNADNTFSNDPAEFTPDHLIPTTRDDLINDVDPQVKFIKEELVGKGT